MIAGQIQLGQCISDQTEDNFSASIFPSGVPTVSGGKLAVASIPIGGVAYASLGTNTTDIAGQLWITDIFIPNKKIITGIGFLQGATATTDNVMVGIYNAQGTLIATSATTGVLLSGASTFQKQALVVPSTNPSIYGGSTGITLPGPAQYFIAVQGNGTAAGAIATVAASTYIDVLGSSLAGTFGTFPATITPPTTFTANKAPIVFVY